MEANDNNNNDNNNDNNNNDDNASCEETEKKPTKLAHDCPFDFGKSSVDIIFEMETSDPDDFFTLCFLLSHPQPRLRAVVIHPGHDRLNTTKTTTTTTTTTSVDSSFVVANSGSKE